MNVMCRAILEINQMVSLGLVEVEVWGRDRLCLLLEIAFHMRQDLDGLLVSSDTPVSAAQHPESVHHHH